MHDVTHFIFVRHGHYAKDTVPARERRKLGLSQQGRQGASHAADFLEKQNLQPDAIVTTKTQRTKETAGLIIESMGLDLEPMATAGGPSKSCSSLDGKLESWQQRLPGSPKAILFCGHHSTQDYCSDLPGTPEIPRNSHCCVFVYECIDEEWHCIASDPGTVGAKSQR